MKGAEKDHDPMKDFLAMDLSHYTPDPNRRYELKLTPDQLAAIIATIRNMAAYLYVGEARCAAEGLRSVVKAITNSCLTKHNYREFTQSYQEAEREMTKAMEICAGHVDRHFFGNN